MFKSPRLRKLFVVLVCMMLVFSAVVQAGTVPAAAAEAASGFPDTLENPGFEQALTPDGQVPGWTQIFGVGKNGSVTVAQDTYAEGTQSLKIEDRDSVNFGVESGKVGVTPQVTYAVEASVQIASGTVQLQARFYRADGMLIPSTEGGIVVNDPNFTSGPIGEWQRLRVSAAAPADAAAVTVVAVSGKTAQGISYWDNVTITQEQQQPEPEQPKRFLTNAGFEQTSGDGTIPGWKVKAGSAAVSEAQAFEGSRSLFVSNVATTGSGINMESDLIDVEEGVSYTLTSNVFLQQGTFQGFYVYVYDEAGQLVKGPTGSDFHLYVNALSPSGEWLLAQGQFTVQPGGKKAKVAFISGNKKSYQFYLDDVSLLQSVANGGFEAELAADGSIPGWHKFNEASDGNTFGVTSERAASGAKSLVIENDPGLYMNVIGNLIPVEPGASYTAMARTFIDYGTAGMYVRYFDGTGKYLGKQNWSIKTDPAGTWFTNYVLAEVPADARYAAVMFAGSNKSAYKYFVDDVALIKGNHVVAADPIPDNSIVKLGIDLGVQIRKATVMRGDAGKDKNGRDVIYTVVQGSPSVFTVIDIETEKVEYSQPMPNTQGAWSVKVSTDGTVYLGAYNLGLLYRYFPATGELKNLGNPLPTKDSVLYPMDAGKDGKMYGGNYPTGSLYEYNPGTNTFTDFGTMSYRTSGERWSRVTVYDQETDKIYVGVGNQARLVEYDLATGQKRDLLPEKYSNITSVYDLNVAGGKLFARKETNNAFETFVINAKTGEQVTVKNGDTGETGEVLMNYSRGVSPKSPIADKVYYAGLGGVLYEYDLNTDTYRSLGVSIEGAAIGFDFVQLNEEGFPGWSLVGLTGNNGKMYKYNLETGKVKVTDVPLPAEPVIIHDIEKGPDGNIYTSGYLAGNMGMYNPGSGESKYYSGIGQGEGMTTVGNKLYIGAYPDAKIYEYDLGKPWNRDNADKLNPNMLFSLYDNHDIPGYTLQDRPFGMAGSEDMGKLFVGTVPKNGLLGGVLAVYDVNTREKPDVYPNLVPDQSILSLVYKDGMLYGGTSIYGGQGAMPTQKEAVLFAWDVAAKKLVYQTVPASGKTAITALHVGPDGNIWGLANGALFIFDPTLRQVIYSQDAFPSAAGRWIDGSMETGTDGNVYATVDGKFFKVDAVTKKVTVLATQTQKVAQDDFGNFYLYTPSGTNLYKFTIPELIVGLVGAELSTADTMVRVGERLPLSLVGLLEKGRTTRNLSGAKVEYTFSKPDRVKVEAEGTLTAVKPGDVRITAKVTFGGVIVETNEINLVISNASDHADPNVPSEPGGK